MPEGPEIRRAADRVAAALEGRIAEEVFFAFERLKPFELELTGRRIESVTTRGKGMLTRFEGGLSVFTHNQLYGRWYVMPGNRRPKTGRQLRFAIGADGRRAMLYSASEIEVLDREAERSHPYLSRLGPDVLSEAPTAEFLTTRLEAARFCRRQLAAVLLDQGFVAGLGNYLRAEILFEAGIHPRRRAMDCTPTERRRLAGRLIAVTRRAYRTRGVTLPPSRARELEATGAARSTFRFWVYDREGESCRACGRRVKAEPVGGRRCYWCPRCQPEAGAARSRKGSR